MRPGSLTRVVWVPAEGSPAFADEFGVGFVEQVVYAALQGGIFGDAPAGVEGECAEAARRAEVLADDVALSDGVAFLGGGYAPECARAEFAVVPSEGVAPFERRGLRQGQAVGAVFAACIGEAAADFPVRGELPFEFGFAAEVGGVDVAAIEAHHAGAFFQEDEVAHVAGEDGERALQVFGFPDHAGVDLAVLFAFEAGGGAAFPVVGGAFGETEAGVVFGRACLLFPAEEAGVEAVVLPAVGLGDGEAAVVGAACGEVVFGFDFVAAQAGDEFFGWRCAAMRLRRIRPIG